jgi:hypothetical protein
MDAQLLSAILLIAGFVGAVLGSALLPPGLYDTEGPRRRLFSDRPNPRRQAELIEQYRTRYNVAQLLNVLWVLLTAVGFVVLALHLRTAANAWVPSLGAAAFVVGSILGVVFIYRQTTDALNAYSGAYSAFETLLNWLWLGGLLLFGVAFLQAGLPAWLGYLTAGAALAYGIFFLVTGAGFMAPFLAVLLSLVIAIVLLRQ